MRGLLLGPFASGVMVDYEYQRRLEDNDNDNNNNNNNQNYNNNYDQATYQSTAVEPGPWLQWFTFGYLAGVVLLIGPMTWLVRKIRNSRKDKKRRGDARVESDEESTKASALLDEDTSIEDGGESAFDEPHDRGDASAKSDLLPKSVSLPNFSGNIRKRKNVVRTQLFVSKSGKVDSDGNAAVGTFLSEDDDMFLMKDDVGVPHILRDEDDNQPVTNEDDWDLQREMFEMEDDIVDDGAWDDHEWRTLPRRIRRAATQLGYSRKTWDEGGRVSTTGKLWVDLTDLERNAAARLGYNEQFWNGSSKKDQRRQEYLEKNPMAAIMEDVTRGWETFHSVIRCDKETKKICKIAIPGTIEAGFGTVMSAVLVAIISRYLGEDALMATAMVDLALVGTSILGSGIGGAEEVMVSQALGMDDYYQAGAATQMSVLLYMMISIPAYVFWSFFIDDFVVFLGLNENVAALCLAYVPIYGLARLIDEGFANVLGGLMRIDGKNWQMMIIDTTFDTARFVAIAYGVIEYGVDLFGMVWIDVGASLIYGLFMYSWCSCMGWLRPYRRGLIGKLSLKNGKMMRRMVKLATPVAFTDLLSSGEWSLLTIFAATMGETEVAAWYISGAIWEVFEYAPEGISSAAVIRIGYHLGHSHPRMAKIASYKSLMFSLIWSGCLTVVFIVHSDKLIAFFTDDDYVANLLADVVPIIGAGNVVMCVGNLAWNVLTAQSRAKIAVWVYAIFGVLGTTIPLASYWTFKKNYNIVGMVAAVVIGYATVSLVLLVVVFTTNWTKRCCKIISALANTRSIPKAPAAPIDPVDVNHESFEMVMRPVSEAPRKKWSLNSKK